MTAAAAAGRVCADGGGGANPVVQGAILTHGRRLLTPTAPPRTGEAEARVRDLDALMAAHRRFLARPEAILAGPQQEA